MRARVPSCCAWRCRWPGRWPAAPRHESLQRASQQTDGGGSGEGSASASPRDGDPSASSSPGTSYAVADPGRFKPPLLTADVLVTSSRSIPASVRHRVDRLPGVRTSMPMSFAALSVNGRTLSLAAADPARFRHFTAFASARSDAVWTAGRGRRGGRAPDLPRKLESPRGYLRLGASKDAPPVHIGAYAPLVKQIDAVVNYKRGRAARHAEDNALLVSTGTLTPSKVVGKLKKALGPDYSLQTLALEFNVGVHADRGADRRVGRQRRRHVHLHPARATAPSPPTRAGSRQHPHREVPIIGRVTGNKGMLPQLRAALTRSCSRAWPPRSTPSEYGGCYVPRYIAHDPSKGLSLHTWGIAIDLNVPGNQRGTVGEMDRQVVAIFKRWGFAWGGDWNYTDPMHFEMDRVVKVG